MKEMKVTPKHPSITLNNKTTHNKIKNSAKPGFGG